MIDFISVILRLHGFSDYKLVTNKGKKNRVIVSCMITAYEIVFNCGFIKMIHLFNLKIQ